MTKNRRRIVAVVVRFQNAIDAAAERANEAYAMDSRVDGGEFSGPATVRALAREENRIARRFGFANAVVAMQAAAAVGAVTSTYGVTEGGR
jgi:hypothetical protein